MREIKETDLVGKTIKSVNSNSINCLKLSFDDDTVIELWTEPAVYTANGLIWGLFIEDNPDTNNTND